MPARPSRKPRESNQGPARSAGDATGGSKIKGENLSSSAKQIRQIADAKHRVGSARGR